VTLDNPNPSQDEKQAEATRLREAMPEVVLSLFVLLKTVISHNATHPFARQMATKVVEAVSQSEPPWALQFIRGGVFRDRELVQMGPGGFRRAQTIAMALSRLGFHEITVEKEVDEDAWLRLCEGLAKGAIGGNDGLTGVEIDGLSWRAIPDASWGDEAEEIDPEVYAIIQLALCRIDCERIYEQVHERDAREGWPWPSGLVVMRRLERALEADAAATARTLELAPGSWTPARRALSATIEVIRVLKKLGVDPREWRAAAHLTLILCVLTFEPRGGKMMLEVSADLLTFLTGQFSSTKRSGLPPHHLRVSTLAHLIAQPDPSKWLPLIHLVSLAHELERERAPEDLELDLTRADLLAIAARDMGVRFAPVWVKALVDVHGAIPVGARVRIGGGEQGVVLDARAQEVDVLLGSGVMKTVKPQVLGLVSSFDM
jgi:hypothetical protein